MKRTIALIFSTIAFSVFAQPDLGTIPAVQQWHYHNEDTNFKDVNIEWPDSLPLEQQSFLERFSGELESIGTKTTERPNGKTLSVQFSFNPKLDLEHKDSYEVDLNRKTVVRFSSYNALVYASRTLLQILSQNQFKNTLPNGLIKDFPKYGKRMLLIDVARKFFTLEEVKDFIRLMAWVKMNELHLHLSDNSWGGYSAYRLESALYPELTAKDGHYSWKEIRELQDFAKSYGITIMPEIDSPGHSLAFTNIRPDLKTKWLSPNYLDITNKDTYTFMEKIIGEVIPHFDAPDFHLGTDEYRIRSIKDDSLKQHLGETFRKYINHFNKVVKKHNKTTRIWSGFEHMPGTTKIDKDIIIDMWETSDAKDKSERGYQFINSTHYYTYIVPGAPYYGVNNKFIYEKWTPEIFSNKATQNLSEGSPGLLGSKLHIWNDFGPTGYTVSEIARLSMPSMMAFSEKMWGTKAFDSFEGFSKLMAALMQVPRTKILDKNFLKEPVVIYENKNIDLTNTLHSPIFTQSDVSNLEYPWTMELTLERTKESPGNEVLLTSSSATIYIDLEFEFKKKDSSEIKRGFAIVRANQTEGKTPLTSHRPDVIIFDYRLPLHKAVKLKIQGEQGKTTMYVNGEFIGSETKQMLCPLESIGTKDENTFQGTIKQLSIKKGL